MRKRIKQVIISIRSAFGIKPVGRKWLEAFSALNGSFERTGWEFGSYVATLVLVAAFTTMFASFWIGEYRHSGWSAGVAFALVYCLGMSCLLVYLVNRAGLRYVFTAGTISAYHSWGRLLWSEELTGLQDVSSFSFRGSSTMTLFWADRKPRMGLVNSLRRAMDALRQRSEAESR